jgi:probable F420-dependent oxidoreductase
MRASLTVWAVDGDWYVPIAQALERAGFEAIWISDHLATPLEYKHVYPYNETGEPGYNAQTPLLDIWPIMGALAASTTTIQIGSGVLILPIRNPFLTAHATVTVQNLSHGRLLFGIGTGWMEEEFTVVGESFAARGARTEEILDVLEKLWTGKPTSHEGHFYRFPPVTHPPAPVSPIPLIGCGLSEGMMGRTARRMDGWFGPAVALDVSMRAVAELDRMRKDLGREGPFASYVRLAGAFEPANLERHRAAGVEHLVVSMALLGIANNASLQERVEAIEKAGERLARFQGEPQRMK